MCWGLNLRPCTCQVPILPLIHTLAFTLAFHEHLKVNTKIRETRHINVNRSAVIVFPYPIDCLVTPTFRSLWLSALWLSVYHWNSQLTKPRRLQKIPYGLKYIAGDWKGRKSIGPSVPRLLMVPRVGFEWGHGTNSARTGASRTDFHTVIAVRRFLVFLPATSKPHKRT